MDTGPCSGDAPVRVVAPGRVGESVSAVAGSNRAIKSAFAMSTDTSECGEGTREESCMALGLRCMWVRVVPWP